MDVNGSAAAGALNEGEASVREQQMSDNLMSPFCPGRTLFSCPSEEALKLRTEIRTLLGGGKREADIESLLVRRYGENILGVPRVEGFGTLIWAGPMAFVLLAGLLLLRVMGRRGPEELSKRKGEEGR